MKCQACQSAHAQVYCQESQAALCNGCSYVMGDITRYRLCALCDCNPARIFCHNDNAALCDACDADIHLSNPLAVRHDRVALGPLDAESTQRDAAPTPKARIARSSSDDSSVATQETLQAGINPRSSETILFVPKAEQNFADFDVFDFDGSLFGADFLDSGAEDLGSTPNSPSDGVVPTIDVSDSAASSVIGGGNSQELSADESPKQLEKYGSFSSSQDLVSCGRADSMQFAACMPAIPAPSATCCGASSGGSFDLPTLHVGSSVTLDREARVMRYREKRKRRTFEKTIRYQSRKAYAEVRPRIKGRFATREEVAAMKAAGACFPVSVCA